MDGRQALAPGTVLRFDGFCCAIGREIGRGASCIVYDASYEDHLGQRRPVRVKETYPAELRLRREADGSLRADARDEAAFRLAIRRMEDSCRRNHSLFLLPEVTNAVANTVDVFSLNGTRYIVTAWMDGATLADCPPETARGCAACTLAAARVLRRIHEAGLLYLDLKPENILVLRGPESWVQLFDFDTVVAVEELRQAAAGEVRISGTKGFAPLEQQAGRLRQIGPASDVYSVGAVLFWLIWGRAPTAFDCAPGAAFDFAGARISLGRLQDRFFRALEAFLRRALAAWAGDRYADMGQAVLALEELTALADERCPCVLSTPLPAAQAFFGREEELAALQGLLNGPGARVVNLHGLGGIGKSSLVRAWAAAHRREWDALLYLSDSPEASAEAWLADDALIPVNTLSRFRGEGAEDYCRRKCRALRELTAAQRVLLIVDNTSPARLNALRPLTEIGWTVLLISREALPDGYCPSMELRELPEETLLRLFAHCARRETLSAAEKRDFAAIAGAVQGHTLTVELIARQIARSYLTLPETAAMLRREGLRALPRDSVDYLRDARMTRAPLTAILDQLVEIDRFSGADRTAMRLLAMFDPPGIRGSLFRELARLDSLDGVNALADAGWLRAADGWLQMHAVLREYTQAWPEDEDFLQAADAFAERLCGRLTPGDERRDRDKQFLRDYGPLRELMRLSEQLLRRCLWRSPGLQHLRCRVLLDAPVDEDRQTLPRMLAVIAQPEGLDADSLYRMYETAAYLCGRLGQFERGMALLAELERKLAERPSAFYLSCCHRAAAILLHNEKGDEACEECLRHEEEAIRAARASSHPEAPGQLAACLLNRTITLMSAGRQFRECGRLVDEAGKLVRRHAGEYDYVRYEYLCTSAMYRAVKGDLEGSREQLREADRLAEETADSPLSYIEHLLEQAAPILLNQGDPDGAAAAARRAMELCGPYLAAEPYQRARSWAEETIRSLEELREEEE